MPGVGQRSGRRQIVVELRQVARAATIWLGILLLFGFEWGGHTETLSKALRSGSLAERRAALESLSHEKRAHPAWRDALALQDPELLAIALSYFSHLAKDEDAHVLNAFTSHPQPEVRAATLSAWERIRPKGSANLLIRAMSDADARVRSQAARSLAGFNTDLVVHALERSLDDPDERVRTAALESLGKANNTLRLRALRKAANDTEPKLRSAALRALAHSDGSAGIIYQGVQDREPAVRAAAVAALGSSLDPSAIKLLATILDQDNAENARLALEALLYHNKLAASDALLERIDSIVRHGLLEDCVNALPHLSETVRAQWRSKLARFLESGSNPVAHAKLLVALARAQPSDISESENALLKLANRSGDVQLDAIRLLGSCRSDRALVTLVRAIGNDDAAVRAEALAGLIDFQELNPRDKRIADGLLETLENANADIRPQVIERIGATGASHLAPKLLPLLNLPQTAVVLATLKALAKMPHPQSTPRLRELLLHSHAKVRWTAAIALGAAGSPDDRAWLEDKLGRGHPWDRAALLVALREIVEKHGTGEDTLDTLSSFARGEREDLAALAFMTLSEKPTAQGVTILSSLLQHRSSSRRTLAAAHLANANDQETLTALRQRAADEKEHTNVRIAALASLAMRRDSKIPMVKDPWAVKLACDCARYFARHASGDSPTVRRRMIAMPSATNTPLREALRAVRFSDGRILWLTTDALGEIHLWNVPGGPIELFDPISVPPSCEPSEP